MENRDDDLPFSLEAVRGTEASGPMSGTEVFDDMVESPPPNKHDDIYDPDIQIFRI